MRNVGALVAELRFTVRFFLSTLFSRSTMVVAVLGLAFAASAISLDRSFGVSAKEIIYACLAAVALAVFLKMTVYLLAIRVWSSISFNGSYLALGFLATPILIVAILFALLVADQRLEHFPHLSNREGFRGVANSDSRWRLVKEASLYGASSFP